MIDEGGFKTAGSRELTARPGTAFHLIQKTTFARHF